MMSSILAWIIGKIISALAGRWISQALDKTYSLADKTFFTRSRQRQLFLNTYLAAIEILRVKYEVGKETKQLISTIAHFEHLRYISEEVHNRLEQSGESIESLEKTFVPNVQSVLLDLAEDLPKDLTELINEHFKEVFEYCLFEYALNNDVTLADLVVKNLLTEHRRSKILTGPEEARVLNQLRDGRIYKDGHMQPTLLISHNQEPLAIDSRKIHNQLSELATITQKIGAQLDNASLAPKRCDLQIALKDGSPVASFSIFQKEVRIGRSIESSIVLPDHRVSGDHLHVAVEGDLLFLCDMGSKNGTLLNDVKLEANVRKNCFYGDAIVIGPYVLRFQKQEVGFRFVPTTASEEP